MPSTVGLAKGVGVGGIVGLDEAAGGVGGSDCALDGDADLTGVDGVTAMDGDVVRAADVPALEVALAPGKLGEGVVLA